ncbi:MAG: B12-binding domain-containing radical SAM protein [Candidatus Hodarchaeota archaeon]
MNVLFIYSLQLYQSPIKPLRDYTRIHFGIAHLFSFLKSQDYQPELLILTRATKNQLIDQYITKIQPNLICFTAVTTEYYFISKIASYIKTKYPSIYLLIGGVHASLNPEKVIRDAFDVVCIGEGEYPLLELVEQLKHGKKPHKIQNLWIKKENMIEKNPTREFVQNLDSLPFPDREIWRKWIHYLDSDKQTILLGRGCPFQCTNCCNHALRKLALGKYVRIRSIGNILKELKEILLKFPKTKEIYFEVETIGVDLKFAINLCTKLEQFNAQRRKPLSFGVNLRIVPNKDFRGLFRALKRANFSFINIGLESGSERIRKNILRRYYSNEDFLSLVQLAKKHGLMVKVYNMIGLPGETLADFNQTITCNQLCLPDALHLNIFFPYPGTDLFKISKEMGRLPSKIDARLERTTPNLGGKGFTKKQIRKEYQWFNYNVYKGHKPFYILLGTVLQYKIYSQPVLYRIYTNLDNHLFFKQVKSILTSSLKFR